MFVYLHFNVPPTRITDLVRIILDEKIYTYGTVTFVYVFCFYQVGLCSFSYIGNGYSIYDFCITIKDLSIFYSRVIIVHDFKSVTFKPGLHIVVKTWRNWPALFTQHQYLELVYFCLPVSPVAKSTWRN